MGVPFDIRTTYRAGTRFGPAAVRKAFHKDSYNEAFGINVDEYVSGVDYGDLFILIMGEQDCDRIRRKFLSILHKNKNKIKAKTTKTFFVKVIKKNLDLIQRLR